MRKRAPRASTSHAVTKGARSGAPYKKDLEPRDDLRDVASDSEWDRHERFLHALRERGRRAATLEAYDARWYAASTGQTFDLATFTPMDAADFRGQLIRTAKPATVARRLLFLRIYVVAAHQNHEVSDDLAKKVTELRAPKPQPAAPKGLTANEARKALRNVEQSGSARDKAILFTFFLTGIRVGELSGLDVGDLTIGPRSGNLQLRAAIAKGGRERNVPLAKEVRDYLQAYLKERADERLAAPAPAHVCLRVPAHEQQRPGGLGADPWARLAQHDPTLHPAAEGGSRGRRRQRPVREEPGRGSLMKRAFRSRFRRGMRQMLRRERQ